MTKPEINVAPLIDVLLVLLIIFMVVTPVKPSKFEAKVPAESKTAASEPHPETLIVSLGVDEGISLNTEKLDANATSTAELINRLKQVFAAREANMSNQRTVFIKAPKRIDYGTVAKIVDAVKMSGAAPISFQIDQLD